MSKKLPNPAFAVTGFVLVAALGAGGVAGARAMHDDRPQAAVVRMVANGDHLTLDHSAVSAGATEIKYTATDPTEHGVIMTRLHDGFGLESALKAANTNDFATLNQRSTFVGGTDVLHKGEIWDVTLDLQPGVYLALDHGETDAGPHFTRGGYAVLNVSRHETNARFPKVDIEATLRDYNIAVPQQLPRHAVVKITNAAGQPHAMTLVKLNPGVKVPDAVKALLSPTADKDPNPPGVEVGFLATLGAGRSIYIHADLAPATYVAACFMPDAKGVPHVMHGMVTSFTVS
jgi:hypothetical protein